MLKFMTDINNKIQKRVTETEVNDDEMVLKNSDEAKTNDNKDDDTDGLKKKIDKEKDTESKDYLHKLFRRIIPLYNNLILQDRYIING